MNKKLMVLGTGLLLLGTQAAYGFFFGVFGNGRGCGPRYDYYDECYDYGHRVHHDYCPRYDYCPRC